MKMTVTFSIPDVDFDAFIGVTLRNVFDQAIDFIVNETDPTGVLKDANGNLIGEVVVTD
jgi:hypothetical protein